MTIVIAVCVEVAQSGAGGDRIVNMAHVGVDRAGRVGYRSHNFAEVTARAVSRIADASVCHIFSGRVSRARGSSALFPVMGTTANGSKAQRERANGRGNE